jgi:hypothetical protein
MDSHNDPKSPSVRGKGKQLPATKNLLERGRKRRRVSDSEDEYVPDSGM